MSQQNFASVDSSELSSDYYYGSHQGNNQNYLSPLYSAAAAILYAPTSSTTSSTSQAHNAATAPNYHQLDFAHQSCIDPEFTPSSYSNPHFNSNGQPSNGHIVQHSQVEFSYNSAPFCHGAHANMGALNSSTSLQTGQQRNQPQQGRRQTSSKRKIPSSSAALQTARNSASPLVTGIGSNKKERRRTQSINNAFTSLRDCIPNVPCDTKLSKIKTLRLATSYIEYLMSLLNSDNPDSAFMEGFKAEIHKKWNEKTEEQKRKELVSDRDDIFIEISNLMRF